MRRYIITALFTFGIILLYQLIDINLFTIDFPRRVTNSLFSTFYNDPPADTEVIICNIGKLETEEVTSKIDTLLKFEPRIVGINLCDFDKKEIHAFDRFVDNKRIVTSSCAENNRGQLSRLIEESNLVTHFKSGEPDYFEIQLSNSWDVLKKRNNEYERIYYRAPARHYYQFDLKDIDLSLPDNFCGKIVLVGYVGDHVTDSVYNYKNCRITPLNQRYGDNNILPDMYDIQISANILSTIGEKQFINEINPFLRVGIILAFCLLNVGLLTLIQTRWLALNLVLNVIIFIILTGFGPFVIVYLFGKNYFLELNELTILLIITTIFTVGSNIRERRASSHSLGAVQQNSDQFQNK